ncbi:N-acetyltransferase B complex non catalytic subunit-domain-containing protein [Xylariaceae sp. FL0662B]|nr:N-acetyltransferase B complex non catalytic subunit-domain-containing protein [Xylariaceae sp. FL0662B]
MKPPRIPPVQRPVYLKHSVDVNLQTAFNEEQWANVINLAKQRNKVTKDPYYLAVEIAARSQSDNATDCNAGKDAVEIMVKDNVTIKDADALDLYELACHRNSIDYPATIGLLRTRLVKAMPKDQLSCVRSFNACLWYSDWKNAQQIAASLHKNFPKNHRYQFQYILATYILAKQQLETSTEKERKMFAGLSKALMDKAFAFRGSPLSDENKFDYEMTTENELFLWVDIRIMFGTTEENLELFRRPNYGPLAFLEEGFIDIYHTLFFYLEKYQAWDDIFQLANKILETAIRIGQKEASTIDKDPQVIALRKQVDKERREGLLVSESLTKELHGAIQKARPIRSKSEGSYLHVCCDYGLIMALVDAAARQPNSKQALKQLHKSLDKLIKALDRSDNLKPLFRKNYDLASLSILYARNEQVTPSAGGPSTLVTHLVDHIVKHYKDKACFGEAISFIPRLSKADVAVFLETLGSRGTKSADIFQGLTLVALRLQIRYFLATTPKRGQTCQFCNTPATHFGCSICLQSIAESALDVYRSAMEDDYLRQQILPHENEDPVSDTAVIGALCLLNLGGIGRVSWKKGRNSPLYDMDIQLFLRAVLWLDSYLTVSSSKNGTHRMLLVKLYLLMGCVSRAKALWASFDIKNALIDSLGSLFIDRLSSIAPGLFLSGSSHDNPIDPYLVHFTRALKRSLPQAVLDSLDNSNYGSLPNLFRRTNNLTASCTTVMAVVEERRGLRSRGGGVTYHAIEDEPLARNIEIEHDLVDITDYEVLSPDLAGEGSTPIYQLVSYGPLPTAGRAHLGLLAERFLDFVCYVQPKEYKPSKPGSVLQLDWEYALSTCRRLEQGMALALAISGDDLSAEDLIEFRRRQEDVLRSLTTPEVWYHRIVWRLAKMVKSVLKHGIISPSTNESRDKTRATVKELVQKIEGQTVDFLAIPEGIPSKIHAFHGFAALHAMGMLRETILAFRYTNSYLSVVLEKFKTIDKTRASNESAWLAPELKKMTAAAVEGENMIKNRIRLLRSSLDHPDSWRDRLNDWTFGNYASPYNPDREFISNIGTQLNAVIPKSQAELWADQVGESWRELVKGWSAVKFD